MDDDAVRQRVLEIDDRLERLVLDVDELGGVAGGHLGGRQDGGDGVADVAHLVLRQRVVRRVLHVLGDRPRAGHRCGPVLGEVVAGVDGDDAGRLRRGGRVDVDDAGVCVRAADERQVSAPGTARSLVNFASPVSSGGSSRRSRRWPMTVVGAASVVVIVGPPQLLGRGEHGLDDVVVAGAAAEVALQPDADVAARSGCGFSRSRLVAAITMPGVQ